MNDWEIRYINTIGIINLKHILFETLNERSEDINSGMTLVNCVASVITMINPK